MSFKIQTSFGYFCGVDPDGKTASQGVTIQTPGGMNILFDRFDLLTYHFDLEEDAKKAVRTLWNYWPSHILDARIIDTRRR